MLAVDSECLTRTRLGLFAQFPLTISGLIATVNTELTATFPEPGATHFLRCDAQVVVGDGAFLIAYAVPFALPFFQLG